MDIKERRCQLLITILLKKTIRIAPIKKVLKAMEAADRELFLEGENKGLSYIDAPLTTSQPSLISEMVALLDIKPDDNVLEIGIGSGYQTAILAKLAKKVFTMEIIPKLFNKAVARFKDFKISNIESKNKSGYEVWGEGKIFDKIIVSAACDTASDALVEQLKTNRILVLPLRMKDETQKIVLIKKNKNGKLTKKELF